MASLYRLVSALLLINALSGVTSSNPDSEIFQDPSNDNESNRTNPKRSAPIINENQPRMSSIETRPFHISTVRDLTQIVPGRMVVIWSPYVLRRTDSTIYRKIIEKDDKPTGNSNGYSNPIEGNRQNIRGNVPYVQPTQYPRRPNSGFSFSGLGNREAGNNRFTSTHKPTENSNSYSNPIEGNRQNIRGNVPYVQPTQYPRKPNPGFSTLSDLGNKEADNNRFTPGHVGPQPSSRPVYTLGDSSYNPAGGSANSGVRPDSGNPNSRVSADSNFFSGIINDFSFNLVNALNLKTNFVISPLSIFIALSMCYLGSEGATKTQMERVLGLDANAVHGSRLHQGVHDLEALVLSKSSEYQLFLANGLFTAKKISVNPEYERDMRGYYSAEVKSLDFENPELSVPVINNWVSKNTRNMIRSFMNGPPSSETRVLILNAIYFKGIWKSQFPMHSTHASSFFPAGGGSKNIPTMFIENQTFSLYRSEDYGHSFIKLPYQGGQVSMIIALPNEFTEPMPTITDEILCSIRGAMTDTLMETVAIPKFKFEYTTMLKEALRKLGITNLFDPNSADLRNMSRQTDLFVSDIAHKAVIEVNEQGTTATAVISVDLKPLILKNTDFIVNRPFAFYVLHEPSGLVLFHGKVFDVIGETVEATPTNNRREDNRRYGSGSRG